MTKRQLSAVALAISLAVAAAFAVKPSRSATDDDAPRSVEWTPVTDGVLKSPGTPHAYALFNGTRALLIDLPRQELLQSLQQRGLTPELLLLTHHHRHTADGALAARLQNVPVHSWTPGRLRWTANSLPMTRSRGTSTDFESITCPARRYSRWASKRRLTVAVACSLVTISFI